MFFRSICEGHFTRYLQYTGSRSVFSGALGTPPGAKPVKRRISDSHLIDRVSGSHHHMVRGKPRSAQTPALRIPCCGQCTVVRSDKLFRDRTRSDFRVSGLIVCGCSHYQ